MPLPPPLPSPAIHHHLAAGGGGQPAWAGSLAILGVFAVPFLQSAFRPALRKVFVSHHEAPQNGFMSRWA